MKKFLLLSVLLGCVAKPPELRIRTYSMLDTLGSPGIVTDEYVEFTLGAVSYANRATYYLADHDLPATKEEGYKQVVIVNEADSVVRFKSPPDFLNWMSVRGYEMQEQRKKKHSTDYTFKRKL